MRRATEEDKQLVVEILMSAFLDIKEGNSLNYFISGTRNRKERAEHLFRYLFDRSLATGEIYISSNELGCILVDRFPARHNPLPLALKKLKTVYKSIGLRNVPKIIKRQNLLDKFHSNSTYVYPTAMAAHQSVSGKGTCVRMIMELLKTYDGEPVTIYTETTTQDNLNIYQKFGFKIIGESDQLGFTMYFLKLDLA